MFEDIIGDNSDKALILEADDIINYVHYTFGKDLDVDINWSTKEVQLSGLKMYDKFCYRRLRDIDRKLKDKSPFAEITVVGMSAELKPGWKFI